MSKHNLPDFAWRNGHPRWVPGPALRARDDTLGDAAAAKLEAYLTRSGL
jgi:hypothetical protein